MPIVTPFPTIVNNSRCPMFAPKGGLCYRCGSNIYGVYNSSRGMRCGYSVEYCETHLVTRCPFCGATFTD